MTKKELTPEQLEKRRAGCRASYAKYKEERRESKAKYNAEHKPQIKAKSKRYHDTHVETLKKKSIDYYYNHKGKFLKNNQKYRIEHQDRILQHQLDVKIEVLTHYGNGKCACVKCGFDNHKALSIDHINGGGNDHRRATSLGGGLEMYRWLKKNNYPEGYQTLCMCCQFIKKADNKETARGIQKLRERHILPPP